MQFETYQEHSQLLDPYLHDIVQPLASKLRALNPCTQARDANTDSQLRSTGSALGSSDQEATGNCDISSGNECATPDDSRMQSNGSLKAQRQVGMHDSVEAKISTIGKYLWVIASVR